MNIENNVGNVGGIIGTTLPGDTEIINCSSEGEINGNRAGGIVGWCGDQQKKCDIKNCYNLAKINATNAGGIIGLNAYAYKTQIFNCINMGIIEGESVGGIVGTCGLESTEKVKIYNSYFLDNVESDIGNVEEIQAEKFNINNLNEKVQELNNYINNSSEIDTTNWKKWKLGADGYPTFE